MANASSRNAPNTKQTVSSMQKATASTVAFFRLADQLTGAKIQLIIVLIANRSQNNNHPQRSRNSHR
jgi:hypothetical protein